MTMKKMLTSNSSKLICAAALPVLAAMMPSKASAAIVVTATAQSGAAHDSFGDTASGYTGYLITVSVDAGDQVAAVDMGSSAGSANGIFGAMLQDWGTATKKGVTTFTPTPVGSTANDTNGSSMGTDSHVLILGANRADVTGPFEDNANAVTPVPASPNGAPPQDASDTWGTGSYLHGVFGVSGGSNTMNLAYVVLPTGATGTFQVDVSEIPSGGGATSDKIVTGTISNGTPPPTKIVSLTSNSGGLTTTNFVGTSNPGGTANSSVITVLGTPAVGYIRGELNGIAGTGKTGQAEIKFTTPVTNTINDPGVEYIGLNIHDTGGAQGSATFGTDIGKLITDLNGATLGFGATDAFLPTDPAVATAAIALNLGKTGEGAYDVILKVPTSAATGLGDSFLGLDLSQDAANLGSLSVTDIAAVPEPATAAGLLIGASGLLLGRRKRKA